MYFKQIFDEKLAQYAYLFGCQATGKAILIDPERDIDTYIDIAQKEDLEIVAVADTHIHADYISGTREFAERGVKVYASDEGDADWKYEWLLNSNYDYQLLYDKDTFRIGNIELQVIHSPGHTPEHLAYLVTDHGGGAIEPMGMVSGDFVFVGDLGRPDLLESAAGIEGVMESSARILYASVQKFLELSDHILIWPGHGAGSACGKALGAVPISTIGYEKRFNAAIDAARGGEDNFVRSLLDGQPEPPMYFARMKRDNRLGPKVLSSLPKPHRLTFDELGQLAGRQDVVVLDARLDRHAFMAGHFPGSIFLPLNKAFNTMAGSYVEEDMPIYLVIEKDDVEEAVRDLIRIGLDRIVGYVTRAALGQYEERGGKLATIEHRTFNDVDSLRDRVDVSWLDVRNMSEYQISHIRGARNIASTRLWVRRDEVVTEGTIAVYCGTGARSATASSLLKRLGHDVIYVEGDYSAWSIDNEHIERASEEFA